MTQSWIQLPSDAANTGKQLQTFDNTIVSTDVYAEAIVPVNSSGVEEGTSANPIRIDPTGTTVQPANISQWDGTAVSAPLTTGSVAGAESGPVVRPIQRKYGTVLTTATLSGGGNYTSSSFDTLATGAITVTAHCVTNVVSASGGFVIQGSDDLSNYISLAIYPNTSTGNAQLTAIINTRYYRISYTNGATAQGNFSLSVTESSLPGIVQLTPNLGSNGGIFPVSTLYALAVVDGVTVYGQYTQSGGSGIPASLGMFTTTAASSTSVMARTPAVFKTVQATASGNTALWTPTSGKKFRLMRFIVDCTANAAISGGGVVVTVTFQDATTAINLAFDIFVPTTAVTTTEGGYTSGWIDIGNGYLSTTANNVLNVNLSSTLTTGNIRVTCAGTEE